MTTAVKWLRSKEGAVASTVILVAFFMRIWNLATPKGFIFDEVYYAKDAHSLVEHGVELQGAGSAEFIVHPPVGKWLIGIGIKLFGFNEFGWRISATIIGTFSVLLIFLVAKKLFENYLLAITASLLTVLDGLHLVHSRVALLDIFLMFFILLSFYCILINRPWLASIALGLALATKWSGIYYMAAFGAFSLYADYRHEKAMESESPIRAIALQKLWRRILQYGILPIIVYVTTWAGWFITKTGWDRKWSPSIISSFVHYHSEMWNFHTHLTDAHTYSANPWSWIIMVRPTSFFYASPKGCGASSCSQEILALGTPLLWWSGLVAIFVTFGYWIARREWQSGLILLGFAAGYLPWFLMQKRTMFTFYSIAFEPFIILLITFAISKFLEPSEAGFIPRIRLYGVYAYIGLVAINFFYFLPLYTAGVISYSAWLHHMWIPSWI
jgi:dolichyl-phosphate-mannose--protein O-mannosyl transferase